MRFEDSPRAEAIRQDKGLYCENCAREVAEVFEDHYCAECIGMLAGQVSRELRTAPPPNYILSDRTRLVVVMKASEIRTALRGSKLTEECDVVAVDAASGELTAVIKRVRWNPDDCRFELEVGPFLGPAYIPPIEDGYGNAPEAVCENCGAPCEYDSEMCLCERCKWGGRDG
jgi:predicted amidophosphoribosyltransferase